VTGYTPAGSTSTTTETEEEVIDFVPGNITDYTDMVKLFLAWGGFYWPLGGDDPLFLMEEWGSKGGRVWGDFFYSGAYPVEPPEIDPSYWDNKSVMDAINQVKETLGFIGYVDNTGGFVWRPPNIWANGNYVTGKGWQGEASIPVVSENTLLMDYGVTIDDASLRSEIVVISDHDPTVYGSFVPGYADGEEIPQTIESSGSNYGAEPVVTDLSLLAGQQRVMLVPDYPFGQGYEDEARARAEVEKFAYLVSLWIHWSYRKGKVKIPANPALDVDDQIRIYEAKTSETYIHYILGMNVTLDMESGSYTADIDTHWLGNGPEASWHMFIEDLPPALLAYLCQKKVLFGSICGEDDSNDGAGIPWVDEPPTIPTTPIEPPRVPSDLIVPYPRVPNIVYVDPADIDPNDDGEVEPASGSDPGTVKFTSNQFMFKFWGPDFKEPSSRRKFRGASDSYSHTILDNRAWPAFELLSDLFDDEGIVVLTASGKVIKTVTGGTNWSNHCWGVANDVNAEQLLT